MMFFVNPNQISLQSSSCYYQQLWCNILDVPDPNTHMPSLSVSLSFLLQFLSLKI